MYCGKNITACCVSRVGQASITMDTRCAAECAGLVHTAAACGPAARRVQSHTSRMRHGQTASEVSHQHLHELTHPPGPHTRGGVSTTGGQRPPARSKVLHIPMPAGHLHKACQPIHVVAHPRQLYSHTYQQNPQTPAHQSLGRRCASSTPPATSCPPCRVRPQQSCTVATPPV